jgi:HEAT repeat protein
MERKYAMAGQEEDLTVLELIEQLQSNDRLKRVSAAGELAGLEGRAKDAIPILRSWIGDADRMSHVTALGAILLIGNSEANDLLPLLVEAAESDDKGRTYAIYALGLLGPTALPAVPALKRLLDNESSCISTSASEALYELTGDPTYVIDVGLRLLTDPDWLQRYVGIEHLEYVGREADVAIAQLEWVAIEDDDEGVRKRARKAVNNIEAHERQPGPME